MFLISNNIVSDQLMSATKTIIKQTNKNQLGFIHIDIQKRRHYILHN